MVDETKLRVGCILRHCEWPYERVRVDLFEPGGTGGFAHPYVEGIYVKKDGTQDFRYLDRFLSPVGPLWKIESPPTMEKQ